jgi:sulfite exporter TauE/SafE
MPFRSIAVTQILRKYFFIAGSVDGHASGLCATDPTADTTLRRPMRSSSAQDQVGLALFLRTFRLLTGTVQGGIIGQVMKTFKRLTMIAAVLTVWWNWANIRDSRELQHLQTQFQARWEVAVSNVHQFEEKIESACGLERWR